MGLAGDSAGDSGGTLVVRVAGWGCEAGDGDWCTLGYWTGDTGLGLIGSAPCTGWSQGWGCSPPCGLLCPGRTVIAVRDLPTSVVNDLRSSTGLSSSQDPSGCCS